LTINNTSSFLYLSLKIRNSFISEKTVYL
jgi:hypothetical protein